MNIEIERVRSYQGLCHDCQVGYYYPGGDCHAKYDDSRPLRCACCRGHGRQWYENQKKEKSA